ncbi:MAG TPA: phospho-sugar mutase [Candidatus Avipropionibacterium avicola]|uniref:Phospho-sugar mutase n=1 Tax=Candidatus Avipropionibacterium avicola TaxID=2840701 RepID=A0A9D1KMC7_9ACTN|nr:phospho-sugar mutase [Candidatus Avipropionibacterium avicola]
MTGSELVAAATRWRDQDPDPATRAELASLLERADQGDTAAESELADAFAGALEFGTAGLRGRLGPGPNRMNRVVVSQAAAALAAHLHDRGSSGPVVVGHDARHNSEVFARDTAEILTGAGIPVLLFDRAVPTPLVPYLILQRGCAGGVVVTASHNPAAYNGYKVYLDDGSQIVPPSDSRIAAHLEQIALGSVTDLPRGTGWETIGTAEIESYVARAAAQVPEGPRELSWVHTSLHGVGAPIVRAAAAAAGFPAPIEVAEQADPDPDFGTVAFPNPEEPGAIDLALDLARSTQADLVIANDPDADRCAVAIRRDGDWQMLRGDEVGALLGWDLLRRGVTGTYAASVVSARRLGQLCEAYHQPYVTTLTGFKWIGRVPGLVFGYEEAIGYCCDPAAVRDKDGITAALQVLALTARLRAEDRTLAELLDELDRGFGVLQTDQLSLRVDDLTLITALMARLRASAAVTLLGQPVSITDLAEGTDDLPPTDALVFTGQDCRVVVRPSGTEPKLKCYLEVTAPPDDDLTAVRALVRRRLADLRAEVAELLT